MVPAHRRHDESIENRNLQKRSFKPVIMTKPSLVIGIGDLHGHLPALEQLVDALQEEYGIFSDGERLHDEVEIVFTGDYIDRGAYSRETIDRVMRLQAKNPDRVRTLFGNHELLALAGRTSATEAAGHPTPEHAYRILTMHGQNGGWTFVQQYGLTPQEACLHYAAAIAPDAPVGAWLRRLLPFHRTRIGEREILFAHGGIPASLEQPTGWEDYARAFQEHLHTITTATSTEKYLRHPLVNNHSIFWDRRIPNGEVNPDTLARNLGVDAIVIGHTPQEHITRYGSFVYNIDVGMCPRYGAHGPAAIIFTLEETIQFDLQLGTTTTYDS